MNQMMMESERIVRLNLMFVCRTTSSEVLVDMGGMVVNDNNHAAGLDRFFYLYIRPSIFQEFTQARNFFHAKFMRVQSLEKGALGANNEYKFIVSMRLDLSQMPDQCDGLTPTYIMW